MSDRIATARERLGDIIDETGFIEAGDYVVDVNFPQALECWDDLLLKYDSSVCYSINFGEDELEFRLSIQSFPV